MPRLSTLLIAVTGFAALAILAAACGGDDSLTEAEFAEQMNEICSDNSDRFEEIGHPESFADMAAMNPQLADAFGETLDRIDALEPPEEIADQASRFVELGRQTGDLLIEMADAAGANDGEAFEAVVGRMGEVAMESDAIANDLGANVCTS